jgi:hypothetical protein
MQAGTILQDNLFNWLRPLDARGKRGGAGMAERHVIALDVPPVCAQGADLVVKTAALEPTNGFIEVIHVDSNSTSRKPMALAGGDVPTVFEFTRLVPGVHRVVVQAANRMLPPVSDYVFVTEP